MIGLNNNAGNGLNWTWTNTIDYGLLSPVSTILRLLLDTEAYDNNSVSYRMPADQNSRSRMLTI